MIRIAINDRVGTIDWVKGHPLPTDVHGYGIDAENVTSIEVTAESVELIYSMFDEGGLTQGLGRRYYERPRFIPRGSTIRLYGDVAKTIIGNLRNIV